MWLLFIRSHFTLARTSARSDRRAEPARQIGAPAPEPVCIERSTSNAPPPQKEHIQTQLVGHDKPEWGNMTSSSLASMHIQFRTLIFHSSPKEQLQERLRLKKSATSLPVAIETLSSPLGTHPESDLPTDLYSGSTPISIMDESDRRISFNLITKCAISLLAVIGALCSPLEPRPERDLATDLYSGSTPIVIKDESNRRIRFIRLEEIYNITTRSDQGIGPSSRNPSKNRSRCRSILWLCTSSPL
jgi:hypothetical protein